MNSVVKNRIEWLNISTKPLNNLDELGIYLSKQTNIEALKTLKLLILANEANYLEKPFNINAVKKICEKYENNNIMNESVIGNLSMNPQNYGLELMGFIINNFKVDFNLEPYDSGFTIFDLFIRSFSLIEDDENLFYKRYDMIDKKLKIIDFMIGKDILNSNQIYQIKEKFKTCTDKRFSYTKEQLTKMETTINKIDTIEKTLSSLKKSKLVSEDISIEEIFNILSSSEQMHYDNDNSQFIMKLNDCKNDNVTAYIANNIPILIKKNIIK